MSSAEEDNSITVSQRRRGRDSSTKSSPALWIIFIAGILLVSTTFLHMKTVPNDAVADQDRVIKLIEYTEKLEGKIAEIESSKMHKAVTAIKQEFDTIKTFVHHEASLVSNAVFKHEDVSQSLPDSTAFDNLVVDSWQDRLVRKLHCLHGGHGGLYLYHTRKAAGTTVRDILAGIGHTWKVKLFETEGNSLDAKFLEDPNLLSVVTLREPVTRAMSLYWYEHVGWFHGILQQTAKCKPLRVWVDAWRDGSEWKSKFVHKNPGTVYVEIENYYVKMLTGWRGPQPVGQEDLEKAKKILEQFDLVLLVEWMQDDTQVTALNTMFPGRSTIAPGIKLKGDASMKVKLKNKLAPDEDAVLKDLEQMNKYDLELWDFAQSLVALRLKEVVDLVHQAGQLDARKGRGVAATDGRFHCSAPRYHLPLALAHQVGVFRPVGHKGPLP